MRNKIFFVVSGLMLLCVYSVAAQNVKTANVKGISKNIKVIRDKWGVNHIYAKNEQDLFFAQG